MILKKINMKNFRQFYGEQEIEFSIGNKNTTVVLGENGAGKTGVFRALIFSLFGEVHISQDNDEDDLHIVNLNALNENNGSLTEASVTIYFEDNKKQYKLKRAYNAVKVNGKVTEREGTIELEEKDEHGNYNPEKITKHDEIDRIVESIVDKDTKDFFFFDGEQIDTLAKTDEAVKTEVKNGIVKLLKINDIETMITNLDGLARSEKARINRESKDKDLVDAQQKSEDLIVEIKNLEDLKNQKQANATSLSKRIDELEKERSENKEIYELNNNRDALKATRDSQQQVVSMHSKNLGKILLDNGVDFLLSDYYLDIDKYLDNVAAENEENIISITALNNSINNMECALCGTDLSNNQLHFDHVQRLRENYEHTNLITLISNIQGSINDSRIEKSSRKIEMQQSLVDFTEQKNKLHESDRGLQNLEDEIREKAYSQQNRDLEDLQRELDKKVKEKEDISLEIKSLEHQIQEKTNEKNLAEKNYDKLLNQKAGLENDSKVLKFINDLNEKLNTIFDEYSDEMRLRLSEETTLIFKTLIGSKDKNLVNKININTKYEIEVIGWENLNITSDLSQGQRQIVSLSFITALSKVATSLFNNTSFPLFMDTPFGRISGENRDQLITNIPELTTQWILLLTDTEFTKNEEEVFRDNNKVGKYYRLEKVDDGHSIIQSLSSEQRISTRG